MMLRLIRKLINGQALLKIFSEHVKMNIEVNCCIERKD